MLRLWSTKFRLRIIHDEKITFKMTTFWQWSTNFYLSKFRNNQVSKFQDFRSVRLIPYVLQQNDFHHLTDVWSLNVTLTSWTFRFSPLLDIWGSSKMVVVWLVDQKVHLSQLKVHLKRNYVHSLYNLYSRCYVLCSITCSE